MNIKAKLKEVIEMFKRMSYQEIQFYKYFIMALLVADIMGIYWYLNFKSLGIALLMVLMGFLAVFLFLEKDKKEVQDKMDEKKDEEKKEEPQDAFLDLTPKDDEDDGEEDNSFSLPSSKEFNERAKKALGTLDDF